MTQRILKPNPLNYFNMRRVKYAVPTFSSMIIYETSIVTELINWIHNNLTGRYYCLPIVQVENSSIVYYNKLGFEDRKELSMLVLSCPHLT
jgi:hypothetical protein